MSKRIVLLIVLILFIATGCGIHTKTNVETKTKYIVVEPSVEHTVCFDIPDVKQLDKKDPVAVGQFLAKTYKAAVNCKSVLNSRNAWFLKTKEEIEKDNPDE